MGYKANASSTPSKSRGQLKHSLTGLLLPDPASPPPSTHAGSHAQQPLSSFLRFELKKSPLLPMQSSGFELMHGKPRFGRQLLVPPWGTCAGGQGHPVRVFVQPGRGRYGTAASERGGSCGWMSLSVPTASPSARDS